MLCTTERATKDRCRASPALKLHPIQAAGTALPRIAPTPLTGIVDLPKLIHTVEKFGRMASVAHPPEQSQKSTKIENRDAQRYDQDLKRGVTVMADIGTEVLFIAGFGPIDRDVDQSRALYRDSLGIPFKEDAGGYLYTGALEGAKHFALWPLSQAAQSCFGGDSWPDDTPVPQAWLEFEVEDVEKATADLEAQGHRMLIKNKKEPWGQTVSRFISPEGLLVGVTFTPSLREQK
jgi:catechol 2,3-dioxygenase-like lactoylglutathione lyase family enzyme